MELNQEQLGAVLHGCLEKAGALLAHEGGFLPFGARAHESQMDFIQLAPEEGETIDSLYNRLVDLLAEQAKRGEIIGSAIVADARVDGEEDGRGVVVLVETAGFSRSVLARYKHDGNSIEFGPLTPRASEPAVFAS